MDVKMPPLSNTIPPIPVRMINEFVYCPRLAYMMEPFRPLIADSVVIMVVNNGEIQPGDFIHAAGSCALAESARKQFIAAFERRLGQEVTHPIFGYRVSYRRLLEVQARLLIRFLTGEIPNYPNFITR
jgi:CRISP-associated protein Cas1